MGVVVAKTNRPEVFREFVLRETVIDPNGRFELPANSSTGSRQVKSGLLIVWAIFDREADISPCNWLT